MIQRKSTFFIIYFFYNEIFLIIKIWLSLFHFCLYRAGELPMEIALQTIEYLGSEMDYVPWQAAQTELSYVRKMLVRTSLYGKYKVSYIVVCLVSMVDEKSKTNFHLLRLYFMINKTWIFMTQPY